MPVFRFPFFYNPNYYNRFVNPKMYNNSSLGQKDKQLASLNNNHINSTSQQNTASTNSNNVNKKNNSKSNDTSENYFFELFGLKLYFDDVLLICLIFFLYQEGVKDDELFLSLILLLLS